MRGGVPSYAVGRSQPAVPNPPFFSFAGVYPLRSQCLIEPPFCKGRGLDEGFREVMP